MCVEEEEDEAPGQPDDELEAGQQHHEHDGWHNEAKRRANSPNEWHCYTYAEYCVKTAQMLKKQNHHCLTVDTYS